MTPREQDLIQFVAIGELGTPQEDDQNRRFSVIYSDVQKIGDLQGAIKSLKRVLEQRASESLRGALILPYATRLYEHKSVLRDATENDIFTVVRSEDEVDASAEYVVRRNFTFSGLAEEGTFPQSWQNILHEYRECLPEPKGFGSDPNLFEYFR
jgi:hypothetical protein